MPDVKVDYGDSFATPTLQAVNGASPCDSASRRFLAGARTILGWRSRRRAECFSHRDDNDASVDLQTLGNFGGVVQDLPALRRW